MTVDENSSNLPKRERDDDDNSVSCKTALSSTSATMSLALKKTKTVATATEVDDTRTSAVLDTAEGKAANFVKELMSLHAVMSASLNPDLATAFHLVPVEKIKEKAVAFFELQQQYGGENKSETTIEIGYHWTKQEYIESIEKHGLLTSPERKQRNIESKFNGARYGDSVYSCRNPFMHIDYGDVCILLARFYELKEHKKSKKTGVVDDSRPLGSKHCMSLLRFDSTFLDKKDDTARGNRALRAWHQALQSLFDSSFQMNKSVLLKPFLRCNLHDDDSIASTSRTFSVFQFTRSFLKS